MVDKSHKSNMSLCVWPRPLQLHLQTAALTVWLSLSGWLLLGLLFLPQVLQMPCKGHAFRTMLSRLIQQGGDNANGQARTQLCQQHHPNSEWQPDSQSLPPGRPHRHFDT